jgi:hypothetical protein
MRAFSQCTAKNNTQVAEAALCHMLEREPGWKLRILRVALMESGAQTLDSKAASGPIQMIP